MFRVKLSRLISRICRWLHASKEDCHMFIVSCGSWGVAILWIVASSFFKAPGVETKTLEISRKISNNFLSRLVHDVPAFPSLSTLLVIWIKTQKHRQHFRHGLDCPKHFFCFIAACIWSLTIKRDQKNEEQKIWKVKEIREVCKMFWHRWRVKHFDQHNFNFN